MPTSRLRTAALVLANLLLPIAVLVFASGFFPYKPVLPGLATFQRDGEEKIPPAAFNRVIFMVVDALRSDFVFGHESAMEFTQSLIRSGSAIPFTAHAAPPTVTMPRVKALTTGSVPSFLDLILNFAESDTSSSLAAQDTWLAQIKAKNNGKGKIVFYGDDTWLKLFPDEGFFEREDGTSSFFVSDFTEVDHNVTRHLPAELKKGDWNAMIMHYLGLDHIGHKTGPRGPNMLPKQKEMDEIVKMIYEAMEREEHQEDTLLVLAGDHGMNAGGNHGGSGPGETEPAFVFASPKFKGKMKGYKCPTLPKEGTEFHYYTKVQQSDLVPTLAGLMGLPISRNSLGVAIPELSAFWDRGHAERNLEQMVQIVEATYGAEVWEQKIEGYMERMKWMIREKGLEKAAEKGCEDEPEGEQRLACLWHKADVWLSWGDDKDAAQGQQEAVNAFLLEAQETLSGTASSYNIPRMVLGMGLTAVIVGLALVSFPSLWPLSTAGTFFALTSVLYGVMMFASSYVEEEQQFWYWITPAWIVLLGMQSATKAKDIKAKTRVALAAIAMLAVHRLSVRWNQTGQKHAGAPDIVHTFFPRAHVFMWLLILGAYAYNGWLLINRAFAGILAPEIGVLMAVVLVVPAVIFKLNFTQADAPELVQGLASQLRDITSSFHLVLQARVVFMALAAVTIIVVTLSVMSARESKRAGLRESGLLPTLSERLHYLLSLFLMTQTRAPNVPLFLGFEFQRWALAQLLVSSMPVTQIATTTLLLSHVYYFCMGSSNSISSIDLSNAYNGVADYNIVAVGVLLFASNWTAPIWWCSAANLLLIPNPSQPATTSTSRSWIDDERKKLHESTLKSTMGTSKPAQPLWKLYISSMTAFIAASLLAVMAACTALRTHLFIWTVFSPKYLYAMAWSVGWHLIVNIGFGYLMRGLVDVD